MNAAEESAVMICESCGGDTTVFHTQRRLWEPEPGNIIDVVKRRRKCLRCEERFITYERRARDPGEVWPLVESAERERDSARRQLRRLARTVMATAEEALDPDNAEAEGRDAGSEAPISFLSTGNGTGGP